MFRNTDVKSGDLVFFQPENDILGVAMKIIGQQAGHVACVFDVVIDEGIHKVRVLETNSEGTSMSIYDLEKMPNVAVKYDTEDYDEAKMRQSIWSIYTEMKSSKQDKYSYNDAADAALNTFLKIITFGVWEKHKLLPDQKTQYCVETALSCYKRNGNKIIVECEDVADPEEVYLEKRFGFRKKFGEVI